MSKAPVTAFGKSLVKSIGAAIGAEPAAKAFTLQTAADAAPEELPELSTADLTANLADFWEFAARRRGRGPQIRVIPVIGKNANGLDRLEIVQDDASFLVDSVMGEIAEQGLSVRAMFHPVVEVARERTGERGGPGKTHRESMIQVFLDPIGSDREAALVRGLEETLTDVRAAVEDFPKMLELIGRTVAELQARRDIASPEELAFLEWLEAERFVFLGARSYEYPRKPNGDYAGEEPVYQAKDGLGVLRDPGRTVLRRAHEPALLMSQAKELLLNAPVLTVAKSNVKSRVHRRAYMDYIGVKRYGDDGCPVGEVRFVGLFTAEAYDQPAHNVPLIREKVAHVLQRADMAPGSHNEKRLKNIVENHPRDELFQMTEDELLDQALGILHLYDRPRVRVFERRDPFDRFVSVLMFVPRDHYDSDLRKKAGDILAASYGGRVSAYYPAFSTTPLARVHYIIGFTPNEHPWPDLKALEGQIVEAARSWEDRFEAAVRAKGAQFGKEPETIGELLAEIFVYSPRFEGIHLRGGKVARGGLRWSDRPDDFRTEVLGLVKAQMVKNTVIVPVGSKGGFVLKKAPPASDREAFMKEGVACYQDYLRGLLDLTDNLVAGKTGAAAAGGARRWRRSLPGGRRRQGHRHLLRLRQRDQRRIRPLAGRRLRLRRQPGLRPQGDGHHGARRLGERQAPLPRDGRRHADDRLHGGRRRRHVGRRVRQRHAAVAAHPAAGGLRPSPHLHRSDARRRGLLRRARAPVQAAALVLGRLRREADLRRAAASGPARRSRCRCRRRRAPLLGHRGRVT
jgi:NAD-specific glutamate dehydrogenase